MHFSVVMSRTGAEEDSFEDVVAATHLNEQLSVVTSRTGADKDSLDNEVAAKHLNFGGLRVFNVN